MTTTAQFMQADNYIQTPEDYIGYNRYAYCRYNPFKYTDPSGEQYIAGSGGGGEMAAAGAHFRAMEEQMQNALAMAAADRMRKWTPDNIRAQADAARKNAPRFGGSLGKGNWAGKAMKDFWSGVKKIFGISSSTSATTTGAISQNNVTPTQPQNENFEGHEQSTGQTCGFQTAVDILGFFGIKVSIDDFITKYVSDNSMKDGYVDWETSGAMAGYLMETITSYGLKANEIWGNDPSDFKSAIDNNQIVMVGFLTRDPQSYNYYTHYVGMYDYTTSNKGTNFIYYDTLLSQIGNMSDISGLKMLYNRGGIYPYYGIGFYK